MERSRRHLARLYLASTMSLVAVIYVIYGGPRWSEPTLVLEATFAWLAVFVPPMVMIEGGLAMIRLVRRLAENRSGPTHILKPFDDAWRMAKLTPARDGRIARYN